MAKNALSDTLQETLLQVAREAIGSLGGDEPTKGKKGALRGGKGLFAGAGLAAAMAPLLKKAKDALQDGSLDELIADLRERGCDVVLATSGKEEDTQRYQKLLGAEDLKYTTSSDVEATKPAPDLVQVALERVDGDRPAVLIGDSTWDCEAAERAGIPAVGLLTGGFSEQELSEAGAVRVYTRLADLLDDLGAVLALARRVGTDATG